MKLLLSELAEGSGAPGTVLDDRLAVACGEGAVRLLKLQRAGAGVVDAEAFLRGRPLGRGSADSARQVPPPVRNVRRLDKYLIQLG